MTRDAPAADDTVLRLLERARDGDNDAREALFERLRSELGQWANGRFPRWARDVADTSDLVQETLVETFKNLDGFVPRGVGALQGYVRQAFRNRLINQLRRAAKRPHESGRARLGFILSDRVVVRRILRGAHGLGEPATAPAERALDVLITEQTPAAAR